MKLNDLIQTVKKGKRVGRGMGSGLGKTSGRGVSGQKSRSGASVDPRFQGGQSPFHKTTPKMKFMNQYKMKTYEISSNVLLSKCEGITSLDAAIAKINIPFKYKFFKVIGDKSILPFKVEKQLKLKNGFVISE